MATSTGRSALSLDAKKKEMKIKKNKQEDRSIPEKSKMGREIEEIFRANKKKKKDAPIAAVEISTKANEATGKIVKKVNKTTMAKEAKEAKETKEKKNILPVDESSENRSKRRRTAEGFSIYFEEELGIGNPDAGNTPLCPFDCSCCF